MSPTSTVGFPEGSTSPPSFPFPELKELILDYLFPHRPKRMGPLYEMRGQFLEAASCAAETGEYERAYQLCERAAAQGNPQAYDYAGDIARSNGDYERALRYHNQGGDLISAGFDALNLHRGEETLQYWKELNVL